MGAGALNSTSPDNIPDEPLETLLEQAERDVDFTTRVNATTKLGVLATRGEPRALEALLHRLETDSRASVRTAAVKALGSAAMRGDREARQVLDAVLKPLLKDVDKTVRSTALGVVAKVAPRGDPSAVAALAQCLKADSNRGVRARAAEVISEVATPGDGQVVAALCERLAAETDGSTKRCIAAALRDLAGQQDSAAIAALQSCRDSDHPSKTAYLESVNEALLFLQEAQAEGHQKEAASAVWADGHRVAIRLAGVKVDRPRLEAHLRVILGPSVKPEVLSLLAALMDNMADSTGAVDVGRFVEWLYTS